MFCIRWPQLRTDIDGRPHDLQHTFASGLVKHDADLRHVQKLLGHASITTTERYAHLQTKDLRRRAEARVTIHQDLRQKEKGAGKGALTY